MSRAAELTRIRLDLRESQAVFGQRFNVNQSTIARWEGGGTMSPLAERAVDRFIERHARPRQATDAKRRKVA